MWLGPHPAREATAVLACAGTDGTNAHVMHDQIAAPASARCLARYLWRAALCKEITGVRHWTDAGEASWYEWACAMRSEGLALGLLRSAPHPAPVASNDCPTAAYSKRAPVHASSISNRCRGGRGCGRC